VLAPTQKKKKYLLREDIKKIMDEDSNLNEKSREEQVKEKFSFELNIVENFDIEPKPITKEGESKNENIKEINLPPEPKVDMKKEIELRKKSLKPEPKKSITTTTKKKKSS